MNEHTACLGATPRMAAARTNAAILLAMCAWFAHRVLVVGLLEAIAEIAGLSSVPAYIAWRDKYQPLHLELFASGASIRHWLDPALARALESQDVAQRSMALRELAIDHGHGVYTVPLFQASFCTALSAEMTNFWHSGHWSAAPNSMNEYGVVIGADGVVGLDGLMAQLRDEVLHALALAFFNGRADTPLASHHSFVVRYNQSEQPDLDMHHDASDVTLNVCLESCSDADRSDAINSSRVVGGAARAGPHPPAPSPIELRFCGHVGEPAHRQRTVTVQHALGQAVIHLGSHRHGATAVAGGVTRQNLILWGRYAPAREFTAAEPTDGATPSYDRTPLAALELPPDVECLSWTHDTVRTALMETNPDEAGRCRTKPDDAGRTWTKPR